MSLKHALLGFLNYGPMTGYEIKKFFDTSVAHFWNAELSQIYPSLKQMEAEGLVEMRVEVQADRPNRKVYTITDDGRRELLDWLARPAGRDQVREPLMIKLFFGAALSRDEIIQVLRHRIAELREANAMYERGCAIIEDLAKSIGLGREAFFWRLTLEAGVAQNRAQIEWAEDTIGRLNAMDDSAFGSARAPVNELDVRMATEILDRIKSEIPGALASAQRTSEAT